MPTELIDALAQEMAFVEEMKTFLEKARGVLNNLTAVIQLDSDEGKELDAGELHKLATEALKYVDAARYVCE